MKLVSVIAPHMAALLPRVQLISAIIAPPGTPADDDIQGTSAGEVIQAGAGNDYVDGQGGYDNIFGEAGDDTLFGEGILYGGVGNDHLSIIFSTFGSIAIGGAGNDVYYTDQIHRVSAAMNDTNILEAAGEGTDTVVSFGGDIDLSLLPNIENILIGGVRAGSAAGNASDNTITGNNSRNAINGGLGADKMIGRGGSDLYVVDNAGDVVTEIAGQGRDQVNSTISYTLTSAVENLSLVGSDQINGTGNELANTVNGNTRANILTGNADADTLNGFDGLDTLVGGTGDDLYIQNFVTSVSGALTFDTVTELAGGGTDTVQVSSDLGRYTYQLDAGVENLVVTGNSIFRLWGNTLNNTMKGNFTANVLDGFAGHDTLTGGFGADSFFFSALAAASSDTITDFTHGNDKLNILASAFGGGLVAGSGVSLISGPTPVASIASGQFLYDSSAGALSFDADGTGAGAAILIATLTNLPVLSAADFLIYT